MKKHESLSIKTVSLQLTIHRTFFWNVLAQLCIILHKCNSILIYTSRHNYINLQRKLV